MKKKILYRDIWQSFTQTPGRFLSLVCLLMLGSFALVGLKVTGPNIEQTTHDHLQAYQTMDLAVIADYGLSADDATDIQAFADETGAQVSFDYFSDVLIAETTEAVRVYSMPEGISQLVLISGALPQYDNEIVLDHNYATRYRIGDTLTMTQREDRQILANDSYTITGFVQSPEVLSRISLGPSQAGDGTLSGVAYVLPTQFTTANYAMARLRFPEVANLNSFQQLYKDTIAQYQSALEQRLTGNGVRRLDTIKQDANKAISDAEQQITDGQQQLADGEQQLADAETQLVETADTLQAAQRRLQQEADTLTQAQAQLDAAQAQLSASQQQLNDAANAIQAGEQTLAQQKAQLEAGKAQWQVAEQQLAQVAETLAQSHDQLTAGEQQHALATQQLQAQVDALIAQGVDPTMVPELVAAREKLDAQAQALNAQRQQYDAGVAQYETQRTRLTSEQAALIAGQQQYDAAVALLNDKKAQYNAGLSAYHSGQQQYEQQRQQLADGWQQWHQAERERRSGEQQLADAQRTLADERQQFIEKQQDATQQFSDGQARIAQHKNDLANLEIPRYTVHTRSTLPTGVGYQELASKSTGISSVGNLFPVVMYCVAALVTFTTMARFVNEERHQAGILKALGYQDSDVLKKFIIYGLVVCLIGTSLGVLGGMYALPAVLGQSLLEENAIPTLQLPFHWDVAAIALACGLLCSVLPAWIVTRKGLREKPAQLLLPKPPASGATIFFERIRPLWRRLSFTHKVTARNIFRYKLRLMMTVFGVGSSVALLYSGLGISASIGNVANVQFGELIRYNAVIATKKQLNVDETQAIQAQLQRADIVQSVPVHTASFTQAISGQNDQPITVFATSSVDVGGLINLIDAQTGAPLHLPEQGVIMTEKLAALMNVRVGDTFTLTDKAGQPRTMQLHGITRMHVGHFILMQPAYYAQVFQEPAVQNGYLLRFANTESDAVKQLTAELMATPGVLAVVQNTDMIYLLGTIVASLNLSMVILTIVVILLAIVILYNLTTINLAERIRELSTIKVLGFTDYEVTLYIYRETIILSLIGIVLGLGAGNLLHRTILQMVATPIIHFGTAVNLWVYLAPIGTVVSILAILGWYVNRHLKTRNMLEALKSE